MSFILPVLAILTGIGLLVLGGFKRPRRRGRMLLGALLVIVPVLEGSRMAYIASGLEWDPMVREASELEGIWRHRATEFELAPDGVWRCRHSERGEQPCDGTAGNGRWSVDENAVTFVSSSGASVTELLVFRYRGAYRLVHNFGDPDDWGYTLDFERVPR